MYSRILSFSFLLLIPYLAPAAYQNINWFNPSPTGNDIYDVAASTSASSFMLVGENGTLAIASDGVSWQFQTTNTNANLRGCVVGPAILVAVGDNGTILRSTNGTTWTAVTGLMANFRSVAYGIGTYAAVGELGGVAYLATSTDGLVWTERVSGLISPLNSVAFQGSTFVVVGDFGGVSTSLSGITWTPAITFTSDNLVSVSPGLGQFIALSDATSGNRIFTSSSGASWTAKSAPSSADGLHLNDVGFFGSLYVIGADQGKLLSSGNTTSWTVSQLRDGYDGDYLAVSGNARGWNVVGRGCAIYRSISGLVNWTQFAQGAQGAYTDIGVGGGYGVTVGAGGKVGGTANFTSWVNRNNTATSENLTGVTYSSNNWIAVGEKGVIIGAGQNGDNWSKRTSPTTSNLNDVAYGSNRFFAVGNGGALLTSTSINGLSWSNVSSGTIENITRVELLNNIFLAGTANGSIIRSLGGAAWSLYPNVLTGQVYGLAWFGNKYYALTQDSTGLSRIYQSSDGTAWAEMTSQADAYLNTLSASGDWLTAISAAGNMLSSNDGVNWTYESGIVAPGVARIIPYDGGGYLAAGNWAKIAQIYVGVAFNVYFGGLANLGNGWWNSSWLGNFNGLDYPVIYQEQQGFWYCQGLGLMSGANSFWVYDYVLGWLWTADGTYPWYYVAARSTWAYYGYNQGTSRWIYFSNPGRWEAIPISQ